MTLGFMQAEVRHSAYVLRKILIKTRRSDVRNVENTILQRGIEPRVCSMF
jgi:hypothetical protein